MDFIRKNPALAVGIGLPIVVVILFALASAIPNYLVAPPQYDALFAATAPYYSSQEPVAGQLKFAIDHNHFKAWQRKQPKEGCCGNNDSELYIFDSKSLRIRQIFIPLPPKPPTNEDWQEFTVPDAENLVIDTSGTAPDGYEFHDRFNYNGDVWPFFNAGPSRETVSLGKDGREVKLALPDSQNMYSGRAIHFLGWVTGTKGGK